MATRLSGELKIDITQVVREYWEIIFLNGFFETVEGPGVVFKGGTALRLAYGSPRFSEDLDFDLRIDSLASQFEELVEGLVRPFAEAEITDLARKRWTYLCEIKITENYLAQPFRIKMEISKRIQEGYGSSLRLLTSPTIPLQVLGNVATLEQLYRDKLDCIEGRDAPKDLFDLWFISQKLKIPYRPPPTSLSKKELTRDLGKYLPRNYRKVIEELL